MRRVVSILTATCIALAVGTGYFAYQLHLAREQLAAARATPATSAPGIPNRKTPADLRAASPVAPDAASAPSDGQEPVRPAAIDKKQMEAAARSGQYQANAYLRKLLSDPVKRAKWERDARKNLEKQLSSFIQTLDLAEDEGPRLLDMLTAQQVRYAETALHCADTPGCDMSATTAWRLRADRRELADLLGAEKAQRLGDYRDNDVERHSVVAFRAELPDALQLSDMQAEKLANALGEERRRVTREWEQRGASVAMTAFSAGLVYYPNNVQGVEERVAEASEFQHRQRERAAEILTAAQLDAFTEQQKDALDFARSGWESEQQARDSGEP